MRAARWLRALAAFLGIAACAAPPARAGLLVTNATFLTMKPGETTPVLGYMLVGDDGRVVFDLTRMSSQLEVPSLPNDVIQRISNKLNGRGV